MAEQAEGQKLSHLRESEAWSAVEYATRSRAFVDSGETDAADHWDAQATAALERVFSAPEYAGLPTFSVKDHVTIFRMLEELGML